MNVQLGPFGSHPYLLGEEDIVEPVVLDHGAGRVVVRRPLEQEDQPGTRV